MSADDEDSLRILLQERLAQCQKSLDRIEKSEFSEVEGINKMRNRIMSEIKFLKLFESGSRKLEKKYLETSNILHLSNIIEHMEKVENLKAILQTFAIRKLRSENEEEDYNSKPSVDKHVVDIVAKKGKQWIKVISRSPRGVLMDWMTGCSRNVFEQAKDYLDMSRNFRKSYVAPEICFYFVAGVPDKIAEQLEKHSIRVIGEMVDTHSLAKIPEDYLEKLEEELEDSDDEDADGFASKLLEQQAGQERLLPARLELLKEIDGNDRWIICQTAFDSVSTILQTVSGPSERDRWEELKKKLVIVKDCISERTQKLSTSDRINERSMTIFGSGDYYEATTVTANKHFISSAYHQGVAFDAIIHEPRALSEQKERPMDWDWKKEPAKPSK